MKGRKPLPEKVKELKGTQRRSRVNENAPSTGVRDLRWIPDELSADARPYWNQVRTKLVNAGIADDLDREALIILCENWCNLMQALEGLREHGLVVKGERGYPVRSPYLPIMHKAQETVTKLLVEFGMTPSSRARVNAEPGEGGAGKPRKHFDLD